MAILRGNQAAFSFAGQTITTIEHHAWEADFQRPQHESTPFGYEGTRNEIGTITIRGTVRGFRDSAANTAVVPDGTAGTMTLTTVSGKSYAFNARLYGMGISALSLNGGPNQPTQYSFISSAASSAAPVTTA